jgi:spore germination protein GerM
MIRRLTIRRLMIAATALVAGVALAGCGTGSQSRAEPLPASAVPFDLLSPAPSNAGGSSAPAAEAVILYFLKDARLVAVARELPAPAAVDARLSALAAGPTTIEAAEGLSSAVSAPGSAPTGLITFAQMTINLTSSFEQLATKDQVEALAQLVYTATAIPGITAVSFRIGDKPVAVPRADNSTTEGPVTRLDYKTLAPLISP